jgi:hypothetical protein
VQTVDLEQLSPSAKLRISEPLPVNDLPASSVLLAISNTFGWLAAYTSKGVCVCSQVSQWANCVEYAGLALAQLSSVRAAFTAASKDAVADFTPQITISPPGRVTHLAFAMGDKVLVAAIDGEQRGLAVWRLKSLVDGSNVSALTISYGELNLKIRRVITDTAVTCLSARRTSRRPAAKPFRQTRATCSIDPVGRCARWSHSYGQP